MTISRAPKTPNSLDATPAAASFEGNLAKRENVMRLLPLVICLGLAAVPLKAHEFWISPLDYTVETGETIKADLRVGQNFKGAVQSYLPGSIRRFEISGTDGTVPVSGIVGDRPALNMPAPAEGLAVVVHETKDTSLTYKDWETFADFVRHKDAEWALARHEERGFSRDTVRERYSRYAKSLVAVGDGAGSDAEVGMLTEIVALANPYTDALGGLLPVRVLYQGAPRADVQVEVFARLADSEVTVARYRTDAEGVARIPVEPGTEYLIDSVVLREIEPEGENGAPWESLWASLTFRVPEN